VPWVVAADEVDPGCAAQEMLAGIVSVLPEMEEWRLGATDQL
jgi:hypothetical protein